MSSDIVVVTATVLGTHTIAELSVWFGRSAGTMTGAPQKRTSANSWWSAATGRSPTRSARGGDRLSNVDLLRDLDRIVDFDAKATQGALDLGMSKQELDRAQITAPAPRWAVRVPTSRQALSQEQVVLKQVVETASP